MLMKVTIMSQDSLLCKQGRHKDNTRAAAFAALGSLSRFARGVQLEAFMEQVLFSAYATIFCNCEPLVF
jgi:hypothetical protein